MPVMKVKGGYRWGEKGKVYPDRASAERQGRAIKASQAREAEKKKRKKDNESVLRETDEYIARIEVYYDINPTRDKGTAEDTADEILWVLDMLDDVCSEKGSVDVNIDDTEAHIIATIPCESKAEFRAYEKMLGEFSQNLLYGVVEDVLKDFGIW